MSGHCCGCDSMHLVVTEKATTRKQAFGCLTCAGTAPRLPPARSPPGAPPARRRPGSAARPASAGAQRRGAGACPGARRWSGGSCAPPRAAGGGRAACWWVARGVRRGSGQRRTMRCKGQQRSQSTAASKLPCRLQAGLLHAHHAGRQRVVAMCRGRCRDGRLKLVPVLGPHAAASLLRRSCSSCSESGVSPPFRQGGWRKRHGGGGAPAVDGMSHTRRRYMHGSWTGCHDDCCSKHAVSLTEQGGARKTPSFLPGQAALRVPLAAAAFSLLLMNKAPDGGKLARAKLAQATSARAGLPGVHNTIWRSRKDSTQAKDAELQLPSWEGLAPLRAAVTRQPGWLPPQLPAAMPSLLPR